MKSINRARLANLMEREEKRFVAERPKSAALFERARKSLLGAAKGKIVFHGDLTRPTLKNDDWKPSL